MESSTGAAPDDVPKFAVDVLREHLIGCHLGHPLVYLPEVPSTNTYALRLAREGANDGTLVITNFQSAGRGRTGRVWQSQPGQHLALSLVLHPRFPPQFLVMASALAVAAAVEDQAQLRAELKWPNDVLVAGRKVCGILIESSGDYAVLGIGVNVNDSLAHAADLRDRAATLAELTGCPIAREPLAGAILKRLDELYGQLQDDSAIAQPAIRTEWASRLVTVGRRTRVVQSGNVVEGMAQGVDEGGALVLLLDSGERRMVTWGDIE